MRKLGPHTFNFHIFYLSEDELKSKRLNRHIFNTPPLFFLFCIQIYSLTIFYVILDRLQKYSQEYELTVHFTSNKYKLLKTITFIKKIINCHIQSNNKNVYHITTK